MNFNKHQKIVLWIGVIIIVLMGLFPPWQHTCNVGMYDIHSEQPAGYFFIASKPQAKSESKYAGIEIDTSRLLIQWVIVATLTAAFLITFNTKHKL